MRNVNKEKTEKAQEEMQELMYKAWLVACEIYGKLEKYKVKE